MKKAMKRKAVWLCLPYLIGIFYAIFITKPLDSPLVKASFGDFLPLILATPFLIFTAIKVINTRFKFYVCALSLILGFFCYFHYYFNTYFPIIGLDGSNAHFTGTVSEISDNGEDTGSYIFTGKIGNKKVKLSYYGESLNIDYGDKISADMGLEIPENSYLFPEKDYNKSQNIFLNVTEISNLSIETPKFSLFRSIMDFRSDFIFRLQTVLDGDELGLVVGLLTGVESYESPQLEKTINNAGLAHVTAVSGLQLAIITGILYFLFKRTKISWQMEYILGEIVLLMFVILTGFPISVIRSFIMCSIFRLAPPLRLKNDIFSVLCITLVIMTAGSPFLIANPSFLLSFSGVFGVGVLAPYFTENSKPILKPIIAMSVVSLTILPASCLFFDLASLTSPIANVLIVPICSLISLIMAIVCFLYIFGLFAYPFVWVAGFLAKIVIWGCGVFAKFPYISLNSEIYPYIFLIILGILSITRVYSDKRNLLTGSFLTSVMAFFVLLSFNKPAKFPQRVDFGDATVIYCNNYADIIDRGGRTDYKSVLRFLEENNIYTVNNLFLLDREQYLFVRYRDISAKVTYYKGENFTQNIDEKAYITGNSQILVEYSDYSFTVNGENDEPVVLFLR